MNIMDPKIERAQKETKCLAGMQTQATSKSNSHFTDY